MISYAQNREDVVLARAFGDQVSGFYIDVGAEHPVFNSVTKHFYDLGWRGINIEPSPGASVQFDESRPEDINLGVGLGDSEGKATYFEGPPENHGSSTFRPELAQRYRRLGQLFTEVPDVPVTTLALVCEEYVGDRTIDLLKIDVEGMEAAVIAGADWHRWRPRVLVVEATEPNLRTPTHQAWEAELLAAGYVHALYDGLNRFYALEDEPELLAALSSPASVLDHFVDATVELERRAMIAERDALAEEFEQHLAEARRRASEAEGATAAWKAEARHAVRSARLLEDRLHHAMDEALRSELGAATLRDRLAEESAGRIAAERAGEAAERAGLAERAARAVVEEELRALRATRTFRWTRPLRAVYRLLSLTAG